MTYLLAATAAATAAPPPAAVTVPMAAGQSISPADVAAYIDPRDIASFMPPPPPTTELVAISGDFFGWLETTVLCNYVKAVCLIGRLGEREDDEILKRVAGYDGEEPELIKAREYAKAALKKR